MYKWEHMHTGKPSSWDSGHGAKFPLYQTEMVYFLLKLEKRYELLGQSKCFNV